MLITVEKLSINQWSKDDRPREKMMLHGASALSDAELIAILIGSGNAEENAVELSRRMLGTCHNNLNTLAKWDISDYARFKGMGPAKSITIMAALELARRRNDATPKPRERITSPLDVYNLFQPMLADLPHEEFWSLLLTQAGTVIDKIRISSGGIDGTYADVRLILREAILRRATQLAVVHNHPSGNAHPSHQDIHLTRTIQKAAEVMNIRMFDHVIVCDGSYYSFADEGAL
jgi:DNA repair protein RadC